MIIFNPGLKTTRVEHITDIRGARIDPPRVTDDHHVLIEIYRHSGNDDQQVTVELSLDDAELLAGQLRRMVELTRLALEEPA